MLCTGALSSVAQQVNDNNTPLHLMKPVYETSYGVPTAENVKQTMDCVLRYIDAETPATLVDKKTGREWSYGDKAAALKNWQY